MNLDQASQGRDNNFNLLRIAAAASVLISHSFALKSGSSGAEPWRAALGISPGDLAVDLFFITSGFLVTASIIHRKSTLEFLWARALRIYPALWTMLIVTVLLAFPLLSAWSLRDYFSSPAVWQYLFRNAVLVTGIQFHLPGMFTSNPWPGQGVNASLWTLPIEVSMYLLLAALWTGLRWLPARREQVFRWLCVMLLAGTGLFVMAGDIHHGTQNPIQLHREFPLEGLIFMFFTGSCFYQYRHRINLSSSAFFVLASALALSTLNRQLFYFTYLFTLGYLLLWIAFVPAGWIRRYNRLGDYSYGIYIYAWPVQQTILQCWPDMGIARLIATAMACSLILAILSWHFVEQKALKHKQLAVNHTRTILLFLSRMTSRRS